MFSRQTKMQAGIQLKLKEKAAKAAQTNSHNFFLQLPQEIHNAIFFHLVDPAYADKFSFVNHAGMHGLWHDESARHIQRSTPNLRALMAIARSCKQLRSESVSIVSDYRTNTFHHFRILDAEDFAAFETFFDKTKSDSLKYRLTPQLKITIPSDSTSLKKVMKALSTMPANILNSLLLELSQPTGLHIPEPKTFLVSLVPMGNMLQLNSISCTKVTRRYFDGMWTLWYSPNDSLSDEQRIAWVGGIQADSHWDEKGVKSTLEDDKKPVPVRSAVQEWTRIVDVKRDSHNLTPTEVYYLNK